MFTDDPDYIVEIGGERLEGPRGEPHSSTDSSASGTRPYISVLFDCCNVYQRIYRNKAGTAYEGHCPRCYKTVHVKIGPGGTSNRFFHAT